MPCPLCSTRFRSREHLKTHLVMHHGVNRFEELVPKTQQEASYYTECLLCQRWVRHTPGSLEDHLSKQHAGSASLRGYFASFVYNRGSSSAVAPPQLLIGPSCSQEAGKKRRLEITVIKVAEVDRVAAKFAAPLPAISSRAARGGVARRPARAGMPAILKEAHTSAEGSVSKYRYAERTGARRIPAMLKDAPISTEAVNKCRYRCLQCHEEFTRWRKVTEHLRTEAKCKEAAGEKKKWEDLVTRKVAHVCRVCMDLLPCDVGVIANHTHSNHKITISAYYKLPPAKDTLTQEEIDAIVWKPTLKKKHTFEDFLKDKEGSLVVADKCIFACHKCNTQFKGFPLLKYHINKQKSTCKGTVPKESTKILVKAVSHQCKICKRLFLCDNEKFSEHLKDRHGLKLRFYGTISESNDLDPLSLIEKQRRFLEDDKKKLCTLMEKVPIVPSQLFVDGKGVQPLAIPRDNTTQQVINLCRFRCTKCSKTCKTYQSIMHHRVICVGNKKYHHTLVAEARAHMCLICAKRILCDRFFIAQHIRGSHKMDFASYKEQSLALDITVEKASFGLERSLEERNKRRALVPVVPTALKELSVPPFKVPGEMTTDWVGDFCRFRCSVCLSFETEKLTTMMHHRMRCSGLQRFDPADVLEAR